jgi:hypothetical protein
MNVVKDRFARQVLLKINFALKMIHGKKTAALYENLPDTPDYLSTR